MAALRLPHPALIFLLCGLVALALVLAACGDEEGSSTGETTTEGGGTTAVQPSEPGDVTSTTLDPGDVTPTIPELPDNDDPAAVQCTGAPQGIFDATAIVGETVADASEAARAEGCEIRVVVRDGKPLAVTDDFRPDRINVVASGGEVVRIEGLY